MSNGRYPKTSIFVLFRVHIVLSHFVLLLIQTVDMFIIILFICSLSWTSAFCPSLHTRTQRVYYSTTISLNLVTEDDVIALVDKAEDLWAKVQTLRNEANDLSIQAETLGQEAEVSAADAVKSLSGKIDLSEEKIAEVQQAQSQSIDLGSLLERAMKASEEADEIEILANEALAASEAALEQHISDFPENA